MTQAAHQSVETRALIFATTTAASGGPAAVLQLLGATVLGRLLEQIESLGVRGVWIVTRPEWKAAMEEAAAGSGVDVTVVPAGDLSEDLRVAADIAGLAGGSLVVSNAHLVTDREVFAGLLADPRPSSGVLMTFSPERAPWAPALRRARGLVASAGSPFHRVRQGTGYFLGVLKVGASHRESLVAALRELADLAAHPRPEGWVREFERKADEWQSWVAGPNGSADRADLALRHRALAEDAVALLLVGLVRRDIDVLPHNVRAFFYASPLSSEAAAATGEELRRHDEDGATLQAAVKSTDGFFTTFLVSPYSKYLARFAARRGWTPNAVTVVSFALGVGAALLFAAGSRLGLVLGAVLLQVSFTVDCVDGQLARYTRTFSKFGAWLDSVFDRSKEYLVYAGLAIGATRGFGEDVWALAAAALALQTVRHLSDFSYVAGQPEPVAVPQPPLAEPDDAPGPNRTARGAAPTTRSRAVDALRAIRRSALVRWGNRIIRLPIGERFALISVTAAIWNPRVTFVALLSWAGVAAVYALSARILLSYRVPERIRRAVTG